MPMDWQPLFAVGLMTLNFVLVSDLTDVIALLNVGHGANVLNKLLSNIAKF